jgi:pyruvate dehydrogenase E1 component beta subunit
VTLVGGGYTAYQCLEAARDLESQGISAEVIDLRVINPLDPGTVINSVARTGRLCVVDGGWRNCGLAGEIIASVMEALEPAAFRARPTRLTLPEAPTPSSGALEDNYYVKTEDIVKAAVQLTARGGAFAQ